MTRRDFIYNILAALLVLAWATVPLIIVPASGEPTHFQRR